MELVFSGSNFAMSDMELANRVGLELALGRGFAFDPRQPRYPVALKTTMQRRARQMRDRRPQSKKAVVKRQQGMLPEGDDHRLLFNGENG